MCAIDFPLFMISHLDLSILAWFRHLTGGSWLFDYSMYCLSDNQLLKGGLFVAALWWFWFRKSEDKPRDRVLVISTYAGCLAAIFLNQLVQILAPDRPRPYVAGLEGFLFPFDLGMKRASSFPSDHAALFLGLATGLWFFSRRAGIVAGIYAVLIICVPRLCLGLHYPSDIVAGAAIGIACVLAVNGTRLRDRIAGPVLKWQEKYPGLFYCLFFLFSYQLATLFDDLRSIAAWARLAAEFR